MSFLFAQEQGALLTEIASLYAKVGADTGDYHRNMRGVRDDLGTSESAMSKFGGVAAAAFKVVAVAVVAVGAAVTTMVATSVSAAAEMEQGVADIGAMMSLTSDESDKLKEHILDLGLDPNLKVSATEAAEAVMALGTAGLSMTQIMGGASEATVLLANATGGDFGEAANIATDVMAQFNVTASQMDAAVDQIAGTTVASKFTIDDYRLALAQAGGVAGMVGVSFEDFNATIAATSSSFAGGSDAGTSFKTFLQRLAPDTEPAKIALKELGLMAADGSAKFFDAAGNLKSMEEIAGLLQTATIGLSDAQKIQTFSTLFGTDAMRTALSLAQGGTAIITKMKGEIGKVDAEELAAKRMDTLKGSWEIFMGVVDTLKISLGDKFLPVARKIVEWASDLATKHGPKLITWVENLTAKIEPAIAVSWDWAKRVLPPLWDNLVKAWDAMVKVVDIVKTAVGPIANAIGKFVSWKDVLITLGLYMAGPLLAAFWGVVSGLAVFAAPILAVIAAVAALRFAWENDLGQIRTMTLNTVQKISDWFFKESGIWQGTWESTAQYIVDVVDRFWRIDLFNLTVGTWSNIKQDLIFTWIKIRDKAVEFSHDVYDAIAGFVNDTIAKVTNWKDRFVSFFVDTFGPTVKKLTDWVSITQSHISQWAKYWVDTFTKWKDDMIARFKPVLDWWEDNIQPWIDSGKAVIQGFWDGIKEVWKRFTDWTSTTWQAWVDRFKNFFGISSPSTLFHGFGQNLMEGLQGGIDANSARVTGAIGTLNDQMVGVMQNGAYRSKAAWENAMMAIANTPFPNMTTQIGVPASQLSGNNAPAAGGIATVIPATMSAYAAELQAFNQTLARSALISEVGLSAGNNALTDLWHFAQQTGQLLNAPGGGGIGAAAQSAIGVLQTDTGGQRVDAILAAVQSLVQAIKEQGLGTAINVTAAPLDSTDNRVELEQLVTYLNALYA